jgi:GNAT superfamily N-acetyltransferase
MRAYFAELRDRFPFGIDVEDAIAAAVTAYAPPRGHFVLGGPDDAPAACGAVQWLDADRGEIKRMWVAPQLRGRGIAGALLARLEQLVRDAGRSTVVLDTNRALVDAIGLYTRRGYVEVPAYNDNADADVWFEKRLS